MGEIIAALREFISRDLMYLLSGSIFLSSLLYSISSWDVFKSNNIFIIIGAGISYVLGYVIQDVFCLIGIVTVRTYHSPNKLIQSLYRRLLGESWKKIKIKKMDLIDRHVIAYERASPRNLNEVERLIALKQVSASISPSSLMSSIVIFVKYFFVEPKLEVELLFASLLLILGLLLIPLNWLKAAQQAQYITRLSDHLSEGLQNKAKKGKGGA